MLIRLSLPSPCWFSMTCYASATGCCPTYTCTLPSPPFPRRCSPAWAPVTLVATSGRTSTLASPSSGRMVRSLLAPQAEPALWGPLDAAMSPFLFISHQSHFTTTHAALRRARIISNKECREENKTHTQYTSPRKCDSSSVPPLCYPLSYPKIFHPRQN